MDATPAAPTAPTAPTRGLSIGLTGGIGSGKSTVAAMLAKHGAAIIDTDAIARSLTAPGGAAIDAIREQFGAEFVDESGALDREKMRALAFTDTDAKRRLEAILHPLIGAQTQAEAARSTAAVKVFDVPLLVEFGRWRDRVDKVLVVDCSEAAQIERVMRRSQWSEAAVRAVIAQQATREARRAVADAVIDNGDGVSLADLAMQVDTVWKGWKPR